MMAFCVLFKSIFRNCADMCFAGRQGLKNLLAESFQKPAASRIVPVGLSVLCGRQGRIMARDGPQRWVSSATI